MVSPQLNRTLRAQFMMMERLNSSLPRHLEETEAAHIPIDIRRTRGHRALAVFSETNPAPSDTTPRAP